MSTETDIGQIMESIVNRDTPDGLSAAKLMNEWFNPRPALMKHVIVIQMIACFIVALFLIITAGDSLSPDALMIAIMGFLLFLAAGFGAYTKL